MKSLIAAAALMFVPALAMAQAAPAPAPAAAADPAATIYDKALGDGWQNWSWAKTELSADIGNPRMPIKVEAQGYQALFLHHAPFSAAPYRGISMLIQSVGGEADLVVLAFANGNPIPDGTKVGADGKPEAKKKPIKVLPGGWTKVVIPFELLGVTKATMLEGFAVQNSKGEPAPNIYVADIMLSK
ncbi:MAG: hypothetical protein ABI810_10860 [Sphingomonas bacterium]